MQGQPWCIQSCQPPPATPCVISVRDTKGLVDESKSMIFLFYINGKQEKRVTRITMSAITKCPLLWPCSQFAPVVLARRTSNLIQDSMVSY